MKLTNVHPSHFVASDDEYQYLPHLVTAKARDYPEGESPRHQHPRVQLVYAGTGVMRVETDSGCWIVPPDRGVWIPARTDHKVTMLGNVEMRTVYVLPDAVADLPQTCCLLQVTPLLRELILALQGEPVAYDQNGRGGLIARLILAELRFLKTPALHLPMPQDARLLGVCNALLARPAESVTLDDIAERLATSPRTVARLFERETGMSFRRWRQHARLVDALGQLGKGDSIAQVAAHAGYANPSAFAVMFKRTLGCEPSRYFSVTAQD